MSNENKFQFIRTRDILKKAGVRKNATDNVKITFEYEDIDVIRQCLYFAGINAKEYPEFIKNGYQQI
jgi:hypothetical protein